MKSVSPLLLKICLGFLLGAAPYSSPLFGAINIDGFSSPLHDRFSNDPSFIANGLDLSGVAIADTASGGRWATMISPNVFLSVQHASFYPANGSSVTFYANNDPLGLSATRTVLNSQRIGTSDVRIGVLDAPLPSFITYYNYATQPLETFGGPGLFSEMFALSPYYLQNAYIFGRSPTAWATELDMAVGRNVLDDFASNIDGTHDAIIAFVDDPGDPNYVTSEAHLQVGDSGAPLMVEDGLGNLTIVGLNWFNGLTGFPELNGFSYVGDYATEIDAYLAANPVPEMQSFPLVLGIAVAAVLGRRRTKRPKTHPRKD